MEDKDLQHIFERQYFHELEQREKIHGRLQLPLGVILAIGGVIGLLLGHLPSDSLDKPVIAGWLCVAAPILALAMATYFFIRALWGYDYELLPAAVAIDQYHDELVSTYASYENHEELVNRYFNKFLSDYYRDCSASNSLTNDLRSERIHDCTSWLIVAALVAAVGSICFQFFGPGFQSKPEPHLGSKDSSVRVEVLENAAHECFGSTARPIATTAPTTAPTKKIHKGGCAAPTSSSGPSEVKD